MAYMATSAAITGALIRDLMALTVEQRFLGAAAVPRPIEWLSDNGAPYTANETRAFGASVGLLGRTTPAYSPESNGMAESLVKTLRRDYVYLGHLDDAETVMRLLPSWLEDYNEVHPHKGLKMQSPREYRRSNSTA
jgi:transposase InsO family protein